MGIYRPSAGILAFAFGGVLRYQFASTIFIPATNGTIDLGTQGIGWKRLYLDTTNSVTVGAVTINKAVGRVNAGTATSTLRVSCNVCTTSDHVFAVCSTDDATGRITSVVPNTNFFDIQYAGPAAQMSIDYLIINAN